MKRPLAILAVLLLLLSGCGPHPADRFVSSTSPDGTTVISVTGRKPTSLDPFTVTMEVSINGKSQGSLQFELASSVLDSTNVKFNWSDPQNCLITLLHTDGEKRVFRYYATSTSVILREEGKQ